MKKYLVLIGAAALILAFASPSLAQAPDWTKAFKTTSLFQIWTVWESKYEFNNGYGSTATTDDNKDLTRRGISQRINFYLEYGDPKYVRGVIGFEADSRDWGEPSSVGTDGNASTWATTQPTRAERMGSYGTDQVQLEIKHVYLDFTIPTTPLILRAGLQSFLLGGRLVQSKDAPGLILTADFAPHKVRAFWWRQNEAGTAASSGVTAGTTDRTSSATNDSYGAEYSMAEKLFNLYAYFLYKNDRFSTGLQADNPYWVGVGGGFRPGNLNFSGQLVYVGGKKDFTTGTDPDYNCYAFELLGEYRIGPGLTAALEFFYASGNDADKTDKIQIYQRPTASESHANFGLGRTVFFWMNFGELGNQHNIQGDFAGFWYGRANVNYSPLAWLNLNFNYLYIGDTSKGTPGTGIDPITQVSGTKKVNSAGRTDADKDFVGHEINLITKLRIYANFTYNIGIAYFIPGDVFDSPAKTADAAWAVNSGMQLVF